MKRKTLALLAAVLTAAEGLLFSQEKVAHPGMLILQSDLVLEQKSGTSYKTYGVDLYIRKKSGVESVMLVETTRDPSGKEDNYAYRATEYNSVNGDEKRYLDGKELKSKYSMYSLISSTVTRHGRLGECFHIFVPHTMVYGYPWTRNGSVEIQKGTFVNIRTFSKKYCDYSGDYQDNPFMFDIADVNPVLTDDYSSVAAEKFEEIAEQGNGLLTYSGGPESLPDDIKNSMDKISPKDKADVVFAIDTTGSMKDDMEMLRKKWIPLLEKQAEEFGDLRLGLLLYRDYGDSYNYKGLPVKVFGFTRSVGQLSKSLDSVIIKGSEGGDVPEAVYEALYASIVHFDWRADAKKKIILIGDAEPHEKPRGAKKITQEDVMLLARENDIAIDAIILPDDKGESRGR